MQNRCIVRNLQIELVSICISRRVKPKRAFEIAQNVHIQVILRMLKVWSGHLLSYLFIL